MTEQVHSRQSVRQTQGAGLPVRQNASSSLLHMCSCSKRRRAAASFHRRKTFTAKARRSFTAARNGDKQLISCSKPSESVQTFQLKLNFTPDSPRKTENHQQSSHFLSHTATSAHQERTLNMQVF